MQGSDSVQRGIELSERLVRTVGRAFYTDNVIVVLDALVSDKYLAEKELPIRLQLRPKDISRVLSQLVKDRLVHTEELEGALYYFINYRAFTNVIRYRVFSMQKRMKEAENLNIHFKCPTCGAIYSAIEVQHLKSKDMQFVCSFCCPGNNFRAIISEPRFRLVGVDNIATDFSERKLNKQLSRSGQGEPFHEGIFDLLKELRNCPLIQNKPSVSAFSQILISFCMMASR